MTTDNTQHEAIQQALEALKANHEWHQQHDEHDGYPDSYLCNQNIAAIAALSHPVEPVASQATPARQEVVAWVRFRTDGGIEGPIMDNDKRMDGRRESGAWTPLGRIDTPADHSADAGNMVPAVAQEQAWRDDVIEECAKVCEQAHRGQNEIQGTMVYFERCARAIRKLKDSQS